MLQYWYSKARMGGPYTQATGHSRIKIRHRPCAGVFIAGHVKRIVDYDWSDRLTEHDYNTLEVRRYISNRYFVTVTGRPVTYLIPTTKSIGYKVSV